MHTAVLEGIQDSSMWAQKCPRRCCLEPRFLRVHFALLSTVLAEAPMRTYKVESALRGAVWDPGASIYGRWKCTQGCCFEPRCGRVDSVVHATVLEGDTGADGVWFRAEGMDVPLCVLLLVLMEFCLFGRSWFVLINYICEVLNFRLC